MSTLHDDEILTTKGEKSYQQTDTDGDDQDADDTDSTDTDADDTDPS
jgi:hypothetical protein